MICGEDDFVSSKINTKKCTRKGDVICYTKPENIIMKQSTSPKTSDTSNISVEKFQSGESLYKTLTFEQGANNELEKCIAFWKSVVENNLQPVKCTIIENKNKKLKDEEQNKFQESEEKLLRLEQEANNKMKQVHEDYRKLWLGVMKDVQKKRLHEVKLIGKARCELCDSVASAIDDNCKVNKARIKTEIKNLRISKDDSRRNLKTSSLTSKAKKDGMTEKIKESSLAENKQEDNGKQESKDYTFIDLIAEKKKQGAYSAWRSNKLTCHCGLAGCRTCGVNPAVISFETPTTPPATPNISFSNEQKVTTDSDKTCNKEEETNLGAATNEESPKSSENDDQQEKPLLTESTSINRFQSEFVKFQQDQLDSSHEISSSFRSSQRSILKLGSTGNVKNRVSVVLKNCNCEYPDCDCVYVEEIQREEVKELEIPSPPPLVTRAVRRDSLIVLRSKLSLTNIAN